MKYKVNDIASVLGVTTNTIRRYEKAGYLSPERDDSGYRTYNSYDITKTAMIRLLIKTGFTHEEIKEMLHNKTDNIKDISVNRLKDIDSEMQRLYFIRHRLKDNIELFNTIEKIGDGFVTMQCPAFKYVLYSKGDTLLTEKDRLKTINDFVYDIPEVQLIRIFKYEDIINKNYIPCNGWAIKEYDIERLCVHNIVKNNKYIETYPSQPCLFGTISIPSDHINDIEYVINARTVFFEKAQKHMKENHMTFSGDIMEVISSLLGDTFQSLICIPYAQ